MIKAKVKLTGVSPFSPCKHIHEEKPAKEPWGDWEKRTWREKMHFDEDGWVFIPGMMIKNCLSESAKYNSDKVEGKGHATYTKHFEAGVMVEDNSLIKAIGKGNKETKINKKDVGFEWVFVPSNGERGGSQRVDKCFPIIPKGWVAEVDVVILDETITKEIFEKTIKNAGSFIGIGRWRPRNNGMNGRFLAEILSWKKED